MLLHTFGENTNDDDDNDNVDPKSLFRLFYESAATCHTDDNNVEPKSLFRLFYESAATCHTDDNNVDPKACSDYAATCIRQLFCE